MANLIISAYPDCKNQKPTVDNGTIITDSRKLYEQDEDYLLGKLPDSWGDHAVIRVRGYTLHDVGAAKRSEDSLDFLITDCSDSVREFLVNKRGSENYGNLNNKEITLTIAVPHEYDPGHVVKRSSKNNQVILIINIFGDFNRGGFDDTNKVMMFQKAVDIAIPFKDDYSNYDYDHFYDDM